jgi:hypothetical protein
VGHKLTRFEAINIATAFAARQLSWPPEFAGALKDPSDPNEWVVHFKSTPPDSPLLVMDPTTLIVIVDETTRRARWFPTR